MMQIASHRLRLLSITGVFLWLVAAAEPQPARVPMRRMAAHHRTVVITEETTPASGLVTYLKGRFSYGDYNLLAKLLPGVEVENRTVWAPEAKQVAVEDFPGGVTAHFELGGAWVTTEWMPLLVGRGALGWEGAALYSTRTEPAVPLVVRVGSGKLLSHFRQPTPLQNREAETAPDGLELSDDAATFVGGEEAFAVRVRASAALSLDTAEDGSRYLSARFQRGTGWLLVVFAEQPARAAEVISLDPAAARHAVEGYYDRLLRCRIETPEPVIDRAFRSALYNLEYNWVEPYGWVECIHHWLALWHMQHTAGAEWIGQADRSRLCTLTHARHLMPDGAVPQFMPNGMTKRDFGGSNQFWAWQARHYWRFTGDREFAAEIAPAFDRVLRQTFNEYDPDHNLLLAWDLQIGNQEDYVATPYDGAAPSIEGINMMLTRAELARGLDDEGTAQLWEGRSREALARLRARLWLPDLGRFAYFVDPHGNPRLDAQYHGLLYPLIWEVVDPVDGYTTLRHVRDRLTGANGEVYCSNNFPNHVGGTWGMQTGEAQQPWAAWALAKAGLRNETWRPLKAAAEWAQDSNHRGAWPEVATEPTPAYFSPPAGLYLAAVVEALFGLQVNRPAGYLQIAPSFPDHWPAARLELPDYRVHYRRDGNRLYYSVESDEPLARRLRWCLPPARIVRVLVDGRTAAYTMEPGVECVVLAVEAPAARRTRFQVELQPIAYRLDAPASVVEGGSFEVRVEGVGIEGVEDRNGVLATWHPTGLRSLQAIVRHGLLDAYLPFGRLGQLTFARRTVFLQCRGQDRVRFWLPLDVTVLPRYEVAPVGEVEVEGPALRARLFLRNNSPQKLAGAAWLRAARGDLLFQINVPPRSQQELTVAIPAHLAALLSPGDNRATVTLPGAAGALDLTLTARQPFAQVEALQRYAAARLAPLSLPAEEMIPDTDWTQMRGFKAYGHMPWAGSRPPLEGLAEQKEIAVPELPGVVFPLPGRRFVPISWQMGRPCFRLELGGVACKKLYLLLIPFLDNHDMFAEVGRVTVRGRDRILHARTLHFPGDLDWWNPPAIVGDFATARGSRGDRFGLLPLLGPGRSDWEEGRPPVFPQWPFWSTSLSVITPTCVMNVLEIDLGQTEEVDSLTLEAIGVDPAFGLVAAVAEKGGGQEALEGTPWLPPAALREPRVIFAFERPGDLLGWTTEGEAFSVAPVPGLFSVPTLNSLAKAGEQATGRALSPAFTLESDDRVLELEFQGGRSEKVNGEENLVLYVVDAQTGERLRQNLVTSSHLLRIERINLDGLQGRTVRLEMIDRNTNTSFAWLGVRRVRVLGVE